MENFPRTLQGLMDALGRAAWLSLEGAPRRVMAGNLVIRRFEGGRERLMKRKFTFDDALAAAEALREISAAHEEAAMAVLFAARLEGLSNDELEELCDRFGVEV